MPSKKKSPADAKGDIENIDALGSIKDKARRDGRHRVLVTILGGVAEAFYDESFVMLEIFDFDEYAAREKDPEPYLDNLVRDWGFPDPRMR